MSGPQAPQPLGPILLVCGGAEPGRDGVGDYTRLLAGELATRGVAVGVLAIADPHVHDERRERREGYDVLRLPASWGWRRRTASARGFVREVDPSWASLQLVSWAYQRYGVAPLLGLRLRGIGAGAWHVMVHETWLGRASPLRRHRWLGRAQRVAVLGTLRVLKPRVVTVSTIGNRELLRGGGRRPVVLPLFGNVPIADADTMAAERQLLFFGATPPEDSVDRVIAQVVSSAARRPLAVVVAGGGDRARADFVRALRTAAAADDGVSLVLTDAGFVDPPVLSGLLQASSAGYVRNARAWLAKSGTMVAMLEHGLPVWAPLWDGGGVEVAAREDLLHVALDAALDAPRRPPTRFLPGVADAMLAELTRASPRRAPRRWRGPSGPS